MSAALRPSEKPLTPSTLAAAKIGRLVRYHTRRASVVSDEMIEQVIARYFAPVLDEKRELEARLADYESRWTLAPTAAARAAERRIAAEQLTLVCDEDVHQNQSAAADNPGMEADLGTDEPTT